MAAPPPSTSDSKTIVWVLVGCAGLVVLGLCLLAGLGAWLASRDGAIPWGGAPSPGGSNAGYFPCELFDEPRRDVVGRDDSTTAMDTDAAMSLDTRQGTLTIRDDALGPYGAYSIEARVTQVQ